MELQVIHPQKCEEKLISHHFDLSLLMSDQLLQDPLQHENEHFEFSSTVNNLRNSRSDHEFVYSDVQRGRKPSSESLPEVRSIFELENGGGQSAPGSSKVCYFSSIKLNNLSTETVEEGWRIF